MTDVDSLRAELHLLRNRVHLLEAVVGRLSRARPLLDSADAQWLAELLPAIAAAAGEAVFATADLAALALLPGNAALAVALAPHTRRQGGLRALGKALARCDGHTVDGLELHQVGTSRDGALWQVTKATLNPLETRAADCAPGAPRARLTERIEREKKG